MTIAIKICGLSNAAALEEAIALGCAYAGMVCFPASPRHVSPSAMHSLAAQAKGRIKTVAVLVDPDNALLASIKNAGVDMLQLHGDESPARIQEIKKTFRLPVIKAIKVQASDDIARANAFFDCADMLLFDARPPAHALPGGNGLAFDWHLLAGRAIPLPWFLSGGLNAENVSEAIRISGTKMVDVSSGVESAAGVKDIKLMSAFVKAAQQ